ncbi:bifunctional tetrahydrofolate synthase/dihydrofolate synthase, partial [Pseudomonas syringae]|nr:bifunctional tetrahydrofolate synthase/dihydrofolate synthase [Pseudomonas syringae]
EKAGIFRSGRPALCGDPAPPSPLLDKARELGCPLLMRGEDFDLTIGPDSWDWRGIARGEQVELLGLPLLDLPMQNAALALQLYALMGYPLQSAALGQVLARTRLTGRLDRRVVHWQGQRLNLLLDVGHNPHAAQFLHQRLAQLPVVGKRRAVFGLLNDKDLEGVVAPLSPVIAEWAVAPLPTPRSRPAEELQAALQNLGARVTSYQSIALALEAQCAHATADDEILLFGSFYCVAEALEWLALHTDEEAANGFAG